jgi:hypothetical protein
MEFSDEDNTLRELSDPHHTAIKADDQIQHAEDSNESDGNEKPTPTLFGGVELSSNAEDREDATPVATYPKIVTLDIGGRIFKVARDTLVSGSYFFHCQLSGGYTWQPESDGSYFLDADPDLFEHLLRFMRRPEVFPLFYTKDGGYNYDLYHRLEAEARYFQMNDLHNWIKEKKYLQAVQVRTGLPVTQSMYAMAPSTYPGNQNEEWHVIPRTKKVYLCPRQIAVHRGRPDQCGAACHKRRAEDGVVYEDEVSLDIVTVVRETYVDQKVCKEA